MTLSIGVECLGIPQPEIDDVGKLTIVALDALGDPTYGDGAATDAIVADGR